MQKNASKTYKKIKHKTKRPKQFLNYIIENLGFCPDYSIPI